MVTALLDTSVLVDLLRKHPPADSWLATQQRLGIAPVVWLELLEGVANKRTQRRALSLLKRFERVDLTSADFDWAIQQAVLFRLSHSVDAMDCLIAAVSNRLQVPLYTRNLRHFAPLLGPLARQPY